MHRTDLKQIEEAFKKEQESNQRNLLQSKVKERLQQQKLPKLAKFNEASDIECIVCKTVVKDVASFNKHLTGQKHAQAVQALRAKVQKQKEGQQLLQQQQQQQQQQQAQARIEEEEMEKSSQNSSNRTPPADQESLTDTMMPKPKNITGHKRKPPAEPRLIIEEEIIEEVEDVGPQELHHASLEQPPNSFAIDFDFQPINRLNNQKQHALSQMIRNQQQQHDTRSLLKSNSTNNNEEEDDETEKLLTQAAAEDQDIISSGSIRGFLLQKKLQMQQRQALSQQQKSQQPRYQQDRGSQGKVSTTTAISPIPDFDDSFMDVQWTNKC